MSSHSLSKRLARFTKPLRIGLGLASPGTTTSDSLPFHRSTASGGTDGRITSLERDMDRLVGGWNQHLPQILAAVSEARQAAHVAAGRNDEVQALALLVERLQAQVDELSARLDRMDERSSDSLVPRAAGPRAAKSGRSRA
ncbi:hypothetical protein [Brevundimonas sp. AAP58]|uniref:hypothetical protein n=1 Tax=Brevundimonas sp. AAP58 TaxID=1523422 RepID=UPI0018D16FC3|nr:hypothetical protein [Brevundimonas sp. AAP58]